ncbi:MAG: hypothetical protein A3A73_00860 [Omnitrophica bacterium RIFCSPLOWO2_01_FULL_50_24]|nr:MAG: hypothetical protein A3A73_00860 [Omnitrophica bacterium RIFCSPLOWO2_01_FULL_50_24]
MILITGITGLLGSALCEQAEKNCSIHGIYLGQYKVMDTPSVRYSVCDVCDRDALFGLLDRDDIECVIHTAGIASVDDCEQKPELAHRSNVIGTKNVIELVRAKNARLVYISSNAVFDGTKPPYSEEDTPHPINRYGALKVECERLVRENVQNHLVVRPILMYGLNRPQERKSFLMWILETLKSGKQINLVNDVYENPLLTNRCADAIWRLIERGKSGIYHIAGKDILNRYEAGLNIARVFGLDPDLMTAVPSSFFPSLAPRPRNTSYTTAKIERELKVKPLGFEEGCLFLKKRILSQKTAE